MTEVAAHQGALRQVHLSSALHRESPIGCHFPQDRTEPAGSMTLAAFILGQT